jgi:hypothetical protein
LQTLVHPAFVSSRRSKRDRRDALSCIISVHQRLSAVKMPCAFALKIFGARVLAEFPADETVMRI